MRSQILITTLLLTQLLPFKISAAELNELEDKAEKEAEGYDFFQEDALKTMEKELDKYEKSHEDSQTIKSMFIDNHLKSKEDGKDKKKGPPFYRNMLLKKTIKLHLNGGAVVQGITPFNGDKITIISEANGVKTTHEILRRNIATIEFSAWKPFRQALENYQSTDFKLKKYYFLPSKAHIVLISGAKIEGSIDPFELLAFPLKSDTGKSTYTAYYADTMVPTEDISELLKDKAKHKTQLESISYKWQIAKSSDPKYYEKHVPKHTIQKIEFIAETDPIRKNETAKSVQ